MRRTFFLFLGLILGCQSAAVPLRAEKLEAAGLENVHRFGPKILSGSEPVGEEAFRSLAALGVRTILSVDGVRPDVETAGKFNLRYVHLPFGYDGIPQERALSIARAARDLEGPIYIHCHRGRHRGPAAAGIALRGLGLCSAEEATGFMKELGTSEHYSGLYRDVRSFHPDRRSIDGADAAFPPVAKTDPLVTTMAAVDRLWDRIAARKRAAWNGGSAAADEALLLLELFAEAGRVGSLGRPQDFITRMKEAKDQVSRLEGALRSDDRQSLESGYTIIKATCNSCHEIYRDRVGR